MPADARLTLDELLDLRWSPLAARLGDRREALLTTVAEQAARHGFAEGVQAMRFANLCMALGPGFEAKADHEWALAILLDERLAPWVKLHQLVVQGAGALRRRGGEGRALAERLAASDQWVLDRFDPPAPPPGARPLRRPPKRLERVPCDLEAAEIRLLDGGFRHEYRLQSGQWQRVAVEAPAPLRIEARHPAPPRVTVLTRPAGSPDAARMQLRCVMHGHCGLGAHAALLWVGPDGAQHWTGEAARAPAWSVFAPALDRPPRLLEETPAGVGALKFESCGLRDEGVPLVGFDLNVFLHDARQCLVKLEREQRWLFTFPATGSEAPAVKPSRVGFEVDGQPLAAVGAAWQRAFDDELRRALGDGLQRLHEAWAARVTEGTLQADLAVFDTRSELSWGWREGPRGLASPPLQRVAGLLDLRAGGELQLAGVVEVAGARAHVVLRAEGHAQLEAEVERVRAETALVEAMQNAVLRWRWPLALSFDPLAGDGGSLFSEAGPCSGALCGAVGLRPSVIHGGTWEWFATLSFEAVATRVVVHDPVLGRTEAQLALLADATLLDWSLG